MEQWTTLAVYFDTKVDRKESALESVRSEEKRRFPILGKLAEAMLILPYSSSGVELIFSTLKLIKTAHRSSLQSPMLNALMHASTRKNLANFNPNDGMRKKSRK